MPERRKDAMSRTRHLFLTGEKQSGKTTAIETFLQGQDLYVDGIRTVRVTNVYGEWSIHLLRAGTDEEPSDKNLLFLRSDHSREEAAARFDALGCAILKNLHDPELILLDEIGPNEEYAQQFQAEVFRLLDGGVPVLGVLQAAGTCFLEQIRRRADVTIYEVTKENRNRIPKEIKNWYCK